MSQGISMGDLIDLQKTTLTNLPMNDFEVVLTNQQLHAVNRWFRGQKKQIESGDGIERNIMFDDNGNAIHVRMFQKTPINIGDTQFKINVQWVHAQTHWSVERREILANRQPAGYIKLLKARRIDGTLSLANLLEARAWTAPNNSADKVNPLGLQYWLNKADVGQTSALMPGDFQGKTIRFTDGSTTATNKAGIDPTAQAKWRNFVGVYDAVNGEFVKRLRRAYYLTRFESPLDVKELREGPLSDYKIYMGINPLIEYEDLANKQNDNNGGDLDKFGGVTVFRRIEVRYANKLDADADDPVIGVNHGHFYPVVLDGDWMRESDPMVDRDQHNTLTTFIDCSYNFLCDNVRLAGFVLSKPPTT
jgi:hypothetical protein